VNFNGDTIGRADFDGTGINQRFITGASGPGGVAVDAPAPTIADLIDSVESLGLRHAVEHCLLANLRRAQRRLDAGNTNRACRGIADFVHSVRAQRARRKIAADDAATLIAEAGAVRDSLGCGVRWQSRMRRSSKSTRPRLRSPTSVG
jgi:hypothetical protein